MHHAEVEGLEIAYQRAGTGPALLLLHGGMADSRVWRPQLEGLSDDFTVVAWDAPGCGRSSDPPEGFGMSDYADCVAGLADVLGLAAPHVLGLSFGGGLALEVYRRHPRLPRSLVLASAYAGWAGSLPPDQVAERRERALRDAGRPAATWVPEYLSGMFGRDPAPAVVQEMAAVMSDTRPAGMIPMVRAFAEADLRGVLGDVDVPTLLLYGGEDQRSPAAVYEPLLRAMPTSRLVVMPGVGHVSNVEAAGTFNREVRRFLAGVAG